jgi:hypothetical protein
MMSGKFKFKVRAGQREFERGAELHRISGLLARRQWGKTTIAARIALKKMMKRAGHTVVFGSVKVDLGREMVRKESAEMQRAFQLLAEQAKAGKALLQVVDGGKPAKGTEGAQAFSADDFAELYEQSRLEFRLYHSRSIYSRTKIVALTPDAVGETGDVIADEVGRVRRFGEVLEAMLPIIASNPDFRAIFTTTPPPDDAHPSFALLGPPIGAELPINPAGNWYKSELGVWVLRVTAFDAYADGVPLYDDDTGAAISPDESRARAHDKDAWDRNYGCRFVLGGTAAVGLLQLDSAQRRGIGRCACVQVNDDLDFDRALAHLREKLGKNPAAVGFDVATTEKEASNPSSVTVMEQEGADAVGVLTVTWKTRDPAIAKERVRRILETVEARPEGGRARRMAIDASNERYFAIEVQREFSALAPVELVVSGESMDVPGQEPVNKKTWLGSRWIAAIDDNHAVLPPERYIRDDFRRVRKVKGSFDCELGPNGEHGDTFDSHKLAYHALTSSGGAIESVEGIMMAERRGPAGFRPRKLNIPIFIDFEEVEA